MSNSQLFYLISSNEKKVLECTPVVHDEYDYSVVLFVKDDGEVYQSEWKSLDKDNVTAFMEADWDISQENPLLEPSS